MNIGEIVKLAEVNDLNLVTISTSWAKNSGHPNPVITAVGYEKWNTRETMAMVIGGMLVMVMMFLSEKPWSITRYLLVSSFLCVLPALFCHFKMPARKNRQDLDRFVEALTLLEKEDGKIVDEVRSNEGKVPVRLFEPATLKIRAEAILHKQALETSELQRFPWRSDEATKAKARFEEMHKLLKGLGLVDGDYGKFFSKPEVKPETVDLVPA